MHSRSPVARTIISAQPKTVSARTHICPDGAVKFRSLQVDDLRQNSYSEHSNRILRMQHLVIKLGVSRSAIYDWLNKRSPRFNSSFPRPFKLNDKVSGGAIGWNEQAVDAWVASRSGEGD